MNDKKRFPVVFFRQLGGLEPVREWLRELPQEDRRRIGHDLKRLEYGWPIGMPLTKSLGSGLHEVRTSLSTRRIARVFFFVSKHRLVAVHGFIKKAQKTPKNELEIARRRKRKWEKSDG